MIDDMLDTGPGRADGLPQALLDSRQRWQAFGALAADLVFETDRDGRLTFIAPDPALGHAGAELLGRPAAHLLAGEALTSFDIAAPIRQRATWLRHADGGTRCLSMSVAPRLDEAGRVLGTRGVGVDVTERERQGAVAAAALRRADLLEHILAEMRQEVLAPRMMQSVLAELTRALGADGAAILDVAPGDGECRVLHQHGADPRPLLPAAAGLLRSTGEDIAVGMGAGGLQMLACPASTRFGDRAALLIWRGAAAGTGASRVWDADDRVLAGSVAAVVRMVLEHESIQRELARQARTDPLTGLLNRRAFLEEAGRRIDRLDREGLPGTLIFIDLDRLKPLNDRLGHEAGDAALTLTAELLRRTFRPADLLARLGGDEFALWLDGSDELTAAERAERLRVSYPAELAHLTAGDPVGMTVSIGIACRPGGSGEDLEALLQRADQAMYEAKRRGGGQWRVSQAGVSQSGGSQSGVSKSGPRP